MLHLLLKIGDGRQKRFTELVRNGKRQVVLQNKPKLPFLYQATRPLRKHLAEILGDEELTESRKGFMVDFYVSRVG